MARQQNTISSQVVSRELLEVCRLKSFMISIHSSHHARPRLLNDLPNQLVHKNKYSQQQMTLFASNYQVAFSFSLYLIPLFIKYSWRNSKERKRLKVFQDLVQVRNTLLNCVVQLTADPGLWGVHPGRGVIVGPPYMKKF